MAKHVLSPLLKPNSVGIVGASPKQTVGGRILQSAAASGFQGTIYPINPNYRDIGGITCYPNLGSLPARPDCVVVAVPARLVAGVLKDAAALRIPAAVVVAEGFADAGTEEGRQRQAEIQRLAREGSMAVTGPCCMGVASLRHPFANSYISVPDHTPAGGVSVISQSGGLTNTVVELGANRGVGFNYLISSGNEAVLETADYLTFLAEDPETKVIACVMEGAKNGSKLKAALEAAARIKPIIVLKLGRTDRGQRATVAHTGTLAGRHEAYAALFRANGVAMVDSIDELVETAALMARAPLPKGNGVTFITISGGATALISDLNDSIGLDCRDLSAEAQRKLQKILGVERQLQNPIDTVGLARLEQETHLTECLDCLLHDERVDLIGVVLSLKRNAPASQRKLLDQVAACAGRATKPLFVLSVASNSLTDAWRDYPEKTGVPILEDTQRGLKAVGSLIDYAKFRTKPEKPARRDPERSPLAMTWRADRPMVTEYESKRILAEAGLPTTREGLARSAAEAVDLAARLGYPVALKVQSPELPHKSDVGGVHLGARTAGEVRDAYDSIVRRVHQEKAGASIDGILVQEMISDGQEMILAMTQDEHFGPLIMLGLGGIFVEVFKDVSFRFPPLEARDALDMLEDLKGSRLLRGFRGRAAYDLDALFETVVSFSLFALNLEGRFSTVEINPLLVRAKGKGVMILDVLMIPKNG